MTDHTDNLEKLYTRNLAKRGALWARIRERRTTGRSWDHSHNTDAETLRVLDETGLDLSWRILQAVGLDADAIELEFISRYADNVPKF